MEETEIITPVGEEVEEVKKEDKLEEKPVESPVKSEDLENVRESVE